MNVNEMTDEQLVREWFIRNGWTCDLILGGGWYVTSEGTRFLLRERHPLANAEASEKVLEWLMEHTDYIGFSWLGKVAGKECGWKCFVVFQPNIFPDPELEKQFNAHNVSLRRAVLEVAILVKRALAEKENAV